MHTKLIISPDLPKELSSGVPSVDSWIQRVLHPYLKQVYQQFVIFNSAISGTTLTPSQITGNQNDYSPTGLSSAGSLRLSTDASRNITGLATGIADREIRIFNVGAQDIVLTNADAASVAANRFLFGANVTLNANESILLWYDATTPGWRAVGRHN